MRSASKFVTALLSVSAISLAASRAADAATINFSYSFGPSSASSVTDNFGLQLFDPSLGNLTGVGITLSTTIAGLVKILNFTGSPQSFTNASSSVPVTVTGPAGTTTGATATAFVASGTVGTTGTLQQPGSAIDFPGLTATQSNTVQVAASNFAAYEGIGTTLATFAVLQSAGTYSGSTGAPPFGVFFGGGATVSGMVRVNYTYDIATTPLPASLPLFAGGLAILSLLGWYRVRGPRRQFN
jgi:hypothetical protein